MEQYQDIWVKGQLESKGRRECAERYEIIKAFCAQYKRPFTVLDIGANLGYFSLRLAEDFDCTTVAIEGNHAYGHWMRDVLKRNENPRILMLRKMATIENLKRLAKVEHFDVVLGLSVIHHLKAPFNEMFECLQSLGDHLIMELPNERNAHGQDIVKQIEVRPEWVELGRGKSHLVKGNTRPIVVASKPKVHLPLCYLDQPHTKKVRKTFIESDFEKKVVSWNNKPETRDWHRGINLHTFLKWNGVYPDKPKILEMLRASFDPEMKHGDVTEWNVILQGDGVKFIDYGDPAGWGLTDAQMFAKVEKRLS